MSKAVLPNADTRISAEEIVATRQDIQDNIRIYPRYR